MAKKRVDLKAAKAARQKKIAIGGAVLLVLLLVFQVPRTLKMLHPAGTESAATTTTTTATTETTPATTPSGSTSTAPVSATPIARPVLIARLAPPARQGQLSVLSASFKSKDPFRQLIKEGDDESSSSSAAAKPASLKVVPEAKPAEATTEPAPTRFSPNAPAAKKITLPLLSATISVNGVREGVDLRADFPEGSPFFHLVKLTKRYAKISISDGSLESGAPTLTLRRGKALTLVNTADGTRYRLVLIATSAAAAVKTPATGSDSAGASAAATTSAPTTTTATTTTTTPTIGG